MEYTPLPLDPDAPHVDVIGGRLAKLLIGLYTAAVTVEEPQLPAIASGTWAGCSLDGTAAELAHMDEELKLLLKGPRWSRLTEIRQVLSGSGPVQAELVGQTKFTAAYARWTEHVPHHSVTVSLMGWTWAAPQPDALWVGKPKGVRFDDDNLVVYAGSGWSAKNLRVEGHYGFYLVQPREGDVLIVIDTHGEALDHRKVALDFRALEFAIGTPLALDEIVALDATHQVVGAAGLGFGRRHPVGGGRRCPVAGAHELYALDDCMVDEHLWIPALCQRVAAKLHEEGEDSPLLLATAAYLDSLTGHIHANYLLAQVALEALCHAIGPKPEPRIRDTTAWHRYVEEQTETIRSHLKVDEGEDHLASVVGLLKHVLPAMPASKRVQLTLSHLGIQAPEDAIREVKKRGQVAHTFLMAKESTASGDELYRRLEIIQTLLVAVIAKHVGYDGPILGWDWSKGRRKIADWWPYNLDGEGRRHYLAIDDDEGPVEATEV